MFDNNNNASQPRELQQQFKFGIEEDAFANNQIFETLRKIENGVNTAAANISKYGKRLNVIKHDIADELTFVNLTDYNAKINEILNEKQSIEMIVFKMKIHENAKFIPFKDRSACVIDKSIVYGDVTQTNCDMITIAFNKHKDISIDSYKKRRENREKKL
eukprot:825542_1